MTTLLNDVDKLVMDIALGKRTPPTPEKGSNVIIGSDNSIKNYIAIIPDRTNFNIDNEVHFLERSQKIQKSAMDLSYKIYDNARVVLGKRSNFCQTYSLRCKAPSYQFFAC